MTIVEATKVLEDIIKYVEPADPPEEHQALNLGIEALKRLQADREVIPSDEFFMLPGETKE